MIKREERDKKNIRKKMKNEKENLKKDLEDLNHDWENLVSHNELAQDEDFLEKMAEEIKQLENDALLSEEDEKKGKVAHMIHHMLSTPWGAPFITDKTLLETALAYHNQEPLNSDLCHFMTDLTLYSTHFNNEFLSIFWSLFNMLKEKK